MKGRFTKLILFICLLFYFSVGYSQSSKVDSLLSLAESTQGDELARIYIDLSKEYYNINHTSFLKYAQEAKSVIENSKDTELKNEVDILLGTGYIITGNFEEGKAYVEKGLEQAREIKSNEHIASAMNSLGNYYLYTGDYNQAVKSFEEAYNISVQEGLEERAAAAQLNLGAIQSNMNQPVEGLKNLLEAVEYFEKRNDLSYLAVAYNNLANSYEVIKNYEKAHKYFNKTLEIYQTNGYYIGQTTVLNNIGVVYLAQKNYSKAIEYYTKTVETANNIDSNIDFYKAYGWIGLAETYIYLQNDSLIRENALLALNVFEKYNMQEGIANAKLALATVTFEENNIAEASKLADEALELSLNIGLLDLEKRIYELKSRIYNKQGSYKNAYETQKLYILINDSILAQERSQELNSMQLEFELSDKNNEIELLQKNNQITDLELKKKTNQTQFLVIITVLLILIFAGMVFYSRSKRKAAAVLKEKNKQIQAQHNELLEINESNNKFLSIIAHDLRNPIGAFKDVIGQLANFPEMFSDELRQQIIGEIRDEAESTYFLLENLLLWAKSQRDSIEHKFEELDIYSIVNNNILVNTRFANEKEINIESNIKKNLRIYADRNMTNLIVRNIISNAIKFTKEGGKITITAKDNGKFIDVAIMDTGVGIPEDMLNKLFSQTNHVSTYGTKNEKGAGLGLLLCKEFIDINNGKISVESTLNVGSTFTISLPKYTDSI